MQITELGAELIKSMENWNYIFSCSTMKKIAIYIVIYLET